MLQLGVLITIVRLQRLPATAETFISASKSQRKPSQEEQLLLLLLFLSLCRPALLWPTGFPEFIAGASIKQLWQKELFLWWYGINLEGSLSKRTLSTKKEDISSCLTPNNISRCAGGQRLKIKVPGCGITPYRNCWLLVHSSPEGSDELSALCFCSTPLTVRGLILWRWVVAF